MILKMYLIISVLTYLVLLLSVEWMKIKYEDINGKIVKSSVKKVGVKNKIISRLRIMLVCFIPVFNIFLLGFYTYLFLFARDSHLEKTVFTKIKEEIDK